MHKIHFVTDHIKIGGLDIWCKQFTSRLEQYSNDEIQVIADPSEATIILFLSSGAIQKGYWVSNHLKKNLLFKRYPERCFIWDTSDDPLSFLPGLYASMPRRSFNPKLHRTFTYWELPTANMPVPPKVKRDIFYSFMGGCTANVRKRLFEMTHSTDAVVEKTANFNHGNWATENVKEPYVDVLRRSQFALCPRGVGASSYRLFEAMRFGAIPVILSDSLVLPDGPDWSKCSIQVPERNIHLINKILEKQTAVEQMSQYAERYYEAYFSEQNFLRNIVRLIMSIRSSSHSRLNDWAFYEGQAYQLGSRIAKRLEKSAKPK